MNFSGAMYVKSSDLKLNFSFIERIQVKNEDGQGTSDWY